MIASIVSITSELIKEYNSFFSRLVPKNEYKIRLDEALKKLNDNKGRYELLGKKFANSANPNGLPWYFIGCIHMRESYFDFTKHLHNGDSLKSRTIHVPAGRPLIGTPPFTWEQSAYDAFQQKMEQSLVWKNAMKVPLTNELLLQMMEVYNGAGYRPVVLGTKAIPSPYLWAGSNIQLPGKYTADGKYSATVIDTQIGAGTLMKYYLDSVQKKKYPLPNS